jgi:hypothetical protein
MNILTADNIYIKKIKYQFFKLKIIKAVHKISFFMNIKHNKMYMKFLEYIKEGNLENIKNMYQNNDKKLIIDIHKEHDLAFRQSCGTDHIDIIIWMWDKSIELNRPINIHSCDEYVFKSACENGNLEIAKWLYQKAKELNSPINIHSDLDFAFRWSCFHGYFDVAKWLWELSENLCSPIDIHSYDEFVFRWSCFHGYLDIAKWIWNKSKELKSPINIDIDKDFMFSRVCQQGLLDVAKWLCDICPKYEIEVIGGKIMYDIDYFKKKTNDYSKEKFSLYDKNENVII